MPTSPRTRWMIVSVIAVLLIVAAGAAIAASNDPETPVSFGPITGDKPPVDGGPIVVEPRAGMAGVFARPFDTATANDDGSAVTIDFVGGVEPCSVLDHVDVRYGSKAVTITLYEGHDPSGGDVACIEIGVFKRVVIPLDRQLGDRRILDGAA